MIVKPTGTESTITETPKSGQKLVATSASKPGSMTSITDRPKGVAELSAAITTADIPALEDVFGALSAVADRPVAEIQTVIKGYTTNPEFDINARDDLYFDRTLVHMAAENGLTNVITALANEGAQLDLLDQCEETPLSLAISPKSSECTILTEAALALVDAGADTTVPCGEHGNLLEAFLLDPQSLKTLAAHGIALNTTDKDENTFLHKLFSLDTRGTREAIAASREGVSGDELDLDEVLKTRSETISFLLQNGNVINAQNSNGQTALHKCLSRDISDTYSETLSILGLDEAIKLIANGADPSISDTTGTTPLHILNQTLVNTVRLEQDYIGREDSGAKVNELIDLMLQSGASVNAKDEAGNTPAYLINTLTANKASLGLSHIGEGLYNGLSTCFEKITSRADLSI